MTNETVDVPAPRLKAVILVKVVPGNLHAVVDVLREIPEITKITSITGEYDILADVEVAHPERLHDIFNDTIDPVPGVRETLTHVVMKEFSRT